MKKNAKNKSTARKLLPAFAMLTVSAISLSSATYAWFTMNREVTVTGMALKTKVGENLLVCADNVEANYTNDLIQTKSALLEPVSTINANDNGFFYTVDAAADGHWQNTGSAGATMLQYAESSSTTNDTATHLGKDGYDNAFNGEYGITPASTTDFDTAYGYVDYVFYLKAIGGSSAYNLNMTECNLIYDNSTIGGGDNAWRVAIFAQDITSNGGDGTVNQDLTSSGKTPISILDIDGKSVNWTADNGISTAAGAKSTVTNASANVTIANISAGSTKYYKVVARVWLEGEDKSCTNTTYAALQDKVWELGLQFEMGGTPVNTIASATNNDTGEIMASPTDGDKQTYTITVNNGSSTTDYVYERTYTSGAWGAWGVQSGSSALPDGTYYTAKDVTYTLPSSMTAGSITVYTTNPAE